MIERSSSTGSANARRRARLGSSRGSRDQITPRPSSAELHVSSPPYLRRSSVGREGTVTVSDSAVPLRAIKVPDDGEIGETIMQTSNKPEQVVEEVPETATKDSPNAERLNVLVAEDDPINSRIIQKRLQKSGHSVYLTVNGEECSSHYGERAAFFDIVLMDMQVSTK